MVRLASLKKDFNSSSFYDITSMMQCSLVRGQIIPSNWEDRWKVVPRSHKHLIELCSGIHWCCSTAWNKLEKAPSSFHWMRFVYEPSLGPPLLLLLRDLSQIAGALQWPPIGSELRVFLIDDIVGQRIPKSRAPRKVHLHWLEPDWCQMNFWPFRPPIY